ncbi:DUF3592 domain-containing protein [Isosphaeraceae bacterium EP7]
MVGLRVAIAAIGVAIHVVGLSLARRSFRLSTSGIRTVATVVASEGDGESVPEMTVEFEGRFAGECRRVILVFGSGGPSVGEAMEILYDPNDPDLACGASWSQLWLLPVLCASLGIIVVVVACIGNPGGE